MLVGKEYVIRCEDVQVFYACVVVWNTLGSGNIMHYAGLTAREISARAMVSQAKIERALTALCIDIAGPIKAQRCQEGTAGPFEDRYSRQTDVFIKFILPASFPSSCFTIAVNDSREPA